MIHTNERLSRGLIKSRKQDDRSSSKIEIANPIPARHLDVDDYSHLYAFQHITANMNSREGQSSLHPLPWQRSRICS